MTQHQLTDDSNVHPHTRENDAEEESNGTCATDEHIGSVF